MMGFTDDPEPHRAAILARRPSPDDDPDGERSPVTDDTTIHLLVTEWGCASGREMGDALRGPQVIETDDAVVVAFAVVPVVGGANCEGNPSTSVTVELSDPLGRRWVYDGLHFPPKPLIERARRIHQRSRAPASYRGAGLVVRRACRPPSC